MEHHTDETRQGFGAAPGEAAPDEEHEPFGDGETTTASAVAEGAEQAEDQEETASEEKTTTASAVVEGGEQAEEQEETASEGETTPAAAAGATTNGSAPSNDADRVELYTEADMEGFRRRWDALLAGFVDDPRASVEQADTLIGELVDRVSQRREQLQDELGHRDDPCETEALRLAIRRYRAIYRAVVRE